MTESLRILILEDNPADAELAQFELQEAGLFFSAKVVSNKNDYIRELRQFSPDLILSDYDLPQYNGTLALAEAGRACPNSPFILVTGAVSEDRAIEILTQGAKDYVLKSRLHQRLAPAVRRAIAESKEQKARKHAEEELHKAHGDLEKQVVQRTMELQQQVDHSRRIEADLLKYSERLELLSYTAGRLLASDKPQQIVEELCLRVMQFLDCHAFFNFLVDDHAGRLHLNACAGIPPETAREIEWLDFGVAVCGCAARDGIRIIAENIPTTPDVRTDLVKSFGIKAYACHPLMEQKRVIGTLSFGTRNRTTFNADELAMMKAVADQVAIAITRVRMEDALKESEARERARAAEWQAFVDAVPSIVFIAHDPECRKMTGNRITNEFLRLKPQANISKSAPPDEKPVNFRAMKNGVEVPPEELPMQQAARGREIRDYEMDIVFDDGMVRTIFGNANPVYDEHGRHRGAIGVFGNVSGLKQTEQALRQTTERLDMAQHAAKVGTWDWNVATGHIEWSTHMYDLFGLDPLKNAASFKLWEGIVHPDDLETASLRITLSLEHHTVLNSDYRIVLPDGQIRWINAVGEGKYDDRNQPVRMIGICMDITERKRAEIALRESEERYRLLAETMLQGVVHQDARGEIIAMNPAAERILGKSREQFLGSSSVGEEHDTIRENGEIFPGSEHPSMVALRTGEQVRGVIMGVFNPTLGEYRWINIDAIPVFKPGEIRPIEVYTVFEDITRRRRDEDALRESEQRFRSLAEEMPHFVWEADVDGMPLYANNRFYEYTGLSVEQMKAGGWLAIQHPDDIPRVRQTWNRALRTFSEYDLESRFRNVKTGEYRWFRIKGNPVRDAAGRIFRWVGTCTDIHEQVQATESLRESEQRLKYHFENSPLAVVEWDADFTVTRWSSEAERIFGWKNEEIVGARIDQLKIIYEEDIPLVNRTMERLVSGEKRTVVSTNRNYTKSGALIECTWHNSVILNAKGRMESVLSLVEDITERRRAEAALRESEGRYRALAENIPDLIVRFDRDLRPVYANPAVNRRTGLSGGEIIGRTAADYEKVTQTTARWETAMREVLKSGETQRYEHTDNWQGEPRVFDVQIVPEISADGTVQGMIGIGRDITARKRVEDLLARQTAQLQERSAQLEEANKELESFSYSVSHDLRAPLRAIDGFARIILRQQGDKFDEKTTGQFNLIRDNARIMQTLIDNLLSFSRVQKASMKIAAIDMEKLTGEVWNEVRKANRERELEFKLNKIISGYGDATLIRQVLFNLIDNAVKFTKNRKPGIIEVNSYEEDNKVIYWMKDNGAGFDMAYYNKLFAVFQRLHAADEYDGTGVGLAIVQRIVNRHGGRVWAEGEVDKGATFYFTLPRQGKSADQSF